MLLSKQYLKRGKLLGFPIVVTGYLLLRFEKKIDSLTNTMQEFKIALIGESDKKNDKR
ncbi:YvrJ family protein [Paenibacillus sp. MAHUQ-46]|uniref:YvrJ family protein n=1 Tax=Paenibacillus roseus TaxID=2798579 RepID=A0A934J6T4_9BACL|nr:YvrJ family protein [Paenibacillus roseus]